MELCSVQNCKSKGLLKHTTGIRFHRIPKRSKNQRDKWCKELNLKKFTDSTRVCSLHFLPTDYFPAEKGKETKRRFLKRGTIPSVNLPNNVASPQEPAVSQYIPFLKEEIREDDVMDNCTASLITKEELYNELNIKEEPAEVKQEFCDSEGS